MSNDTSSHGVVEAEAQNSAAVIGARMPYTDVAKDMLFDTRISDGAFRLYAHLRVMGEAGRGITRKSLAESLGVTTRTVSARIAELVKLGRIEIVPRYSETGAQIGSEYVLNERDPR